ncbi:MAG: GntR family transcriptional regulator [Proteobacteria bacterium]|nr:GntR family transcriptional regulator [Pseudomonadota bacterium]
MDLKVLTQTVQGQAVRNLREAITSGIFQPGDRLVEAEMCARLGISRPSLREALRSLEAERLIVMVPNKGPHIPILSLEEAKAIYEVRALLEGEAAALFAGKATVAALEAMKRALAGFDAATKQEDLQAQLETTRQFYEQILSGCGNRIIEEMLSTLTARITFLRSKSMSQPGRAHKSSREMRAIFKAVSVGDAAAAREAAVEHVRMACRAATEKFLADQVRKKDWLSRSKTKSSNG